jgi:hypothetical protein
MHIREILRRLLMGRRYARYWKELRSQQNPNRNDARIHKQARRNG